jgi:hypothetical protein
MTRHFFLVPCTVLAMALLSGCATTSRMPADILQSSYTVSRDGHLQYRVPVGWFDATADSQAVGHSIWLMRSDYGATIAVDEVSLDAAARTAVRAGGLLELASLVVSLSTGDRGAVLIAPPVETRLDSRTVCQYTMMVSETRDTLRVTLLDTGTRTYAVTALRSEKKGGQEVPLPLVAERFVGALRW